MTAAPGPLGAPAGVATIQPAGTARRSGRWAEAALLGVALVLGLGGFVLTALNRTGSSPAQTVGVAIAFLVLTVLMHLCVRYAAPWADPVLLPTAVALNGIGLAMIRRLDLAYEVNEQWQFYVGSKQLVWTLLGVILFCAVLFLLRAQRQDRPIKIRPMNLRLCRDVNDITIHLHHTFKFRFFADHIARGIQFLRNRTA